jgi:hypothetical protein
VYDPGNFDARSHGKVQNQIVFEHERSQTRMQVIASFTEKWLSG